MLYFKPDIHELTFVTSKCSTWKYPVVWPESHFGSQIGLVVSCYRLIPSALKVRTRSQPLESCVRRRTGSRGQGRRGCLLADGRMVGCRFGLGKKTREPRIEPKLPRTDTEGTGTEEVRFLFGSMILRNRSSSGYSVLGLGSPEEPKFSPLDPM
jgi:hypothetical protein